MYAGVRMIRQLADIFSRICTHCGVAYTSLDFPNRDLIIKKNYLEKDISCRDILSYIAQLSCSYAYINANGSVSLKWFADTNYTVSEKQRLNGTVSVTGVQFTDADGVKFLNPDGNMPVAISAVEEYTDGENTVKGVPYLDFKIGTADKFYQNGKPVERPDDTTRARVGYDSNTSSLNLSSDGSIKFRIGRNYSDNTVQTVDYTMSGSGLVPSASVNLGSSANKWDNIYANADVITTSDRNFKEDISDIDERLLKAWSKINYKVFRFKNGKRRHVGVIAQEIQSAFESEGLNARDFGLFCEDTDENGNTILGVRYSECLALECALLRKKIGA